MPCPMRFGPEPRMSTLSPVRRAHLVLVLVGRVVVRRLGLELGAARVDGLERGAHAGGEPRGAHVAPRATPHSHASCASEKPRRLARRQSRRSCRRSPISAEVRRAPRRSAGSGRGTTGRPWWRSASASTLMPRRSAASSWNGRSGVAMAAWRDELVVGRARRARPRPGRSSGPSRPCSSERMRLLQRLGEGAADGHGLADRLHLTCRARPGVPGNFSNAHRGTLVTT